MSMDCGFFAWVDVALSTKYHRLSTEGYAHDGRLFGTGALENEIDGNKDTRFVQVQAVKMT